ncbi:MAG: hypothetical protein IPK69_02265 [Phycisphaerales bacterium]|nr:MAG: hypothetical protein IPK69_02265 [Phycisphaerales bacterium]
MSQQDPQDSAAQRREVVIATLAAAVHRWHRDQIRAGVRAKRAASIAPGEHHKPESSRLDPAEDDRPDRPLPLDPDTAAGHVGGERAGGLSWR